MGHESLESCALLWRGLQKISKTRNFSVPLNSLYEGPWFQGKMSGADYQVQSQLDPLKSTNLCSPWTDNHHSGRICTTEPVLCHGMLWIQEAALSPLLRLSHMEISALAPTRCHYHWIGIKTRLFREADVAGTTQPIWFCSKASTLSPR